MENIPLETGEKLSYQSVSDNPAKLVRKIRQDLSIFQKMRLFPIVGDSTGLFHSTPTNWHFRFKAASVSRAEIAEITGRKWVIPS